MAVYRRSAILVVLVLTSLVSGSESVTVNVRFDRWMYPFNLTAGIRANGSTFGAVGNPAFDDHDAQVLIGFDTTSVGIPASLSPSQYKIQSLAVSLSTATPTAQSFELDSSYDGFSTYLDDTTDTDVGRPVELYGVGARNGFTALRLGDAGSGPPFFEEKEAFGFPGPPSSEARHVFASDYDGGVPRDVSNNVRNTLESNPWAVGTVEGLAEGESVPMDSTMVFSLDTSNSDAIQYLQSGLSEGALFFAVASMHSSTQGSSEGIPLFHLGDASGASAGQTAQLTIDYEIVPEPTGLLAVFIGLSCCFAWFRKRSSLP